PDGPGFASMPPSCAGSHQRAILNRCFRGAQIPCRTRLARAHLSAGFTMQSTTKRLRPYQVRLVTDVCRATEDVLVEQPTGSGKTVQIVTLVAMHLGRRFSHALISAPQEQIEQGFVKRDYQVVA